MISVLILTLDEEINISGCIVSVPWKDDIYILDSGSSDSTVQIAESLGAKAVSRKFTNYADQRNFGLELPFENDWVLMLDADECLTEELAAEIEETVRVACCDVTMCCVRRKDIFINTWLRRSSGYPTWFPRLFRKGAVTVNRSSGKVSYLEGHLLHYPFSKGVSWWYERHNRYSTMEAETLLQERSNRRFGLRDVISANPMARRAAMKQLAYRMPARPLLMFLHLYILRAGFLDGKAGYCYARMRFVYELMIDTKLQISKASNLQEELDGHA